MFGETSSPAKLYMTRKSRLSSDSSLARSHDDGAKVAVVQIAEHDILGTIAYRRPRHWVFHQKAALEACSDLRRLHGQVELLPLGENNMRSVDDMEFIEEMYDATTRMIVSSVLTVQHFCEEVEHIAKVPRSDSTIQNRLKIALAGASIPRDVESAGYSALGEILERRDALEHPRAETVYDGHDDLWHRVPLAWGFSDRSVKAFDAFDAWFDGVARAWEERRAELERPGMLEVTRGIRSDRPSKKPPKTGIDR